MTKYTWDEFESRIALSEKMFNQIESLLNDFLDYVTLDFDHLHVHSLKLVTIMLEIGPEILNSFDLAVFYIGARSLREAFDPSIGKRRERLLEKEKELRKKKRSLTFGDYYSFLDTARTPKLSQATIRLRDLDAYIMPFETINSEWWESYNLLKHDKYSNLKRATLENALKASSALFWLVYYNSKEIHLDEAFSSNLFVKVDPYEIERAHNSLKKL